MLRASAIFALVIFAACQKPAAISEREAATQSLAKYLAAELRPASVLVLSNPFSQTSGRPPEIYAFEKAALAGLKSGFGEKVPLDVAFPELRPEALQDASSVYIDPKTTTPLSFLVAENAFQKAVEQHPRASVVVSLIGLPAKLEAFPAWAQPGAPRFALLLPDWRMIGDREAIAAAFRSGKLAAAVVRKPGTAPGESFQLITGKNAEEWLNGQPALFGP